MTCLTLDQRCPVLVVFPSIAFPPASLSFVPPRPSILHAYVKRVVVDVVVISIDAFLTPNRMMVLELVIQIEELS